MVIKSEKFFPLCILIVVVTAVIYPSLFLWIKPHIPLFLGGIMFSIGLTLQSSDFKELIKLRWKIVSLAIMKYSLLPMLTIAMAYALRLRQQQLLGLLIVSACPGGTAAGVMTYLARANTALTIMLTFLTTLLSPLLTPHHSLII